MTIKALLHYEPMWDDFSLYSSLIYPTGQRFRLICNIEEKKITELTKPFIECNAEYGLNAKEFCQAIMDTAWENGMRPSGFTDAKNETTAIKYHLEDMRKLVFERALTIKQLP